MTLGVSLALKKSPAEIKAVIDDSSFWIDFSTSCRGSKKVYMLTEHYINLGPVRTRYFEGGEGNSKPVVLIHEGGFGADALNTYGDLAEILVKDYHVIMPEMLGFGGTDKAVFFGENPYEPRLRHIECLLNALDITDAHFVGNSFGGGVVLRLSIRPGTRWRMKSATSICGTGGPFRTPAGIQGAFEYTPSVEAARVLDTWILGDGVTDEKHSRRRFDSSMRPGQWESMMAPRLKNPSAPTAASTAWDLPNALSRSQTPTMLIAGTQDRMLEVGWEKKMAEHLADCKIQKMESGHSPNISQPEATAKVLIDFFESIAARQR